ncbi:MAG: hypothetical protein JXR34_11915 [Bacteroidales bacterium]|nr:hypothetical protein [Bacteroidales bacterium]
MTIKQLRKLRSELPSGALKEIADETKTPISTVSMVLSGQRKNLDIIDLAILKRNAYQNRIKDQNEKIKQL